jgi:hypothetical protein
LSIADYRCYACGTDKSVAFEKSRNKYRASWVHNWDKSGNVICRTCYIAIFYIPSHRERFNELQLEYYHKKEKKNRRFWYKGRLMTADRSIKVGVCNLCRAVSPFDTVQTQMHHEEYDDDNPSANTLEVCNRCHGKISTLQEKIMAAIYRLVREETGFVPLKREHKPIIMSRTRQIYLERRNR